MGCVVSATPRPPYPRERCPVPIVITLGAGVIVLCSYYTFEMAASFYVMYHVPIQAQGGTFSALRKSRK
jgi:hypothetical protein